MSAREAGPRLGRGLAALLGDAPASAPETDGNRSAVREIAIDLLEPSPFQPRAVMDPESLAELTESIQARGILQPLLARPHPSAPGRYQIIAGERRWRAAQQAGLHEVPILLRPLEDMEAMAAALVENLQRQDLNPIEEAEGYRKLLNAHGMTQETLAQAVGKSRSHVANTVRLLQLPEAVQAEVRKGALSGGHARALLMHPEPQKAALAVIAQGMSVRQTEALVSKRPPQETGASERLARDPEIQSLERNLSERLGLRVQIGHRGPSGSLRIDYASLDQLDGVISLLTAG